MLPNGFVAIPLLMLTRFVPSVVVLPSKSVATA
jgi:hypothetical protein